MKNSRPADKAWSWKVNLLAFGLVTVAVLLYSLGQVYYLRQTLQNHLRDNREMVLSAVNRQIELGALAEDALNDTIHLFLANTARFLNFLHGVDPFHEEELASFADENGLVGVAVVGGDHEWVSGPADWLSSAATCAGNGDLLSKEDGFFLLVWPRPRGGCVLVGYPDQRLKELQEQFSLAAILPFLATSPEIAFLEIAGSGDGSNRSADRDVALQVVHIQGQEVVIGFATGRYRMQLRKIWQNFILYASFFVGFGLLITFILYRVQQQHIAEITRYERELAREQEDASLGRAAAIIAHEVRNPLNAIGLGLQRIDMEAELGPEHKALLVAMEQAMQRTNTIVKGLLRFARPLMPRYGPVSIDRVLAQQLLLRQAQAVRHTIRIDFTPGFSGLVQADNDLLAQLFDNIIKNALEAQPQGGWLRVVSSSRQDGVLICFDNGGFTGVADIERLAEPYFSGKTRGSGLGLAVCAKIVAAHQGSLEFEEVGEGVLQVRVWLPSAVGSRSGRSGGDAQGKERAAGC